MHIKFNCDHCRGYSWIWGIPKLMLGQKGGTRTHTTAPSCSSGTKQNFDWPPDAKSRQHQNEHKVVTLPTRWHNPSSCMDGTTPTFDNSRTTSTHWDIKWLEVAKGGAWQRHNIDTKQKMSCSTNVLVCMVKVVNTARWLTTPRVGGGSSLYYLCHNWKFWGDKFSASSTASDWEDHRKTSANMGTGSSSQCLQWLERLS